MRVRLHNQPVSAPRGLSLFYSYAHEDEDLRDQLDKHLAMLKRSGTIAEWHDRRIEPGKDWANEISKHLDTADLILLLVSADFLTSDYCYEREAQRALKRHEAGEARLIPVILRAADWSTAPFGKLLALPTDAVAVTSWRNLDEAFLNVAKGIRAAAESMIGSRPSDWQPPRDVVMLSEPFALRHQLPMSGAMRIPDLTSLRLEASRRSLIEHVSDSWTVRLIHYPTAVFVDARNYSVDGADVAMGIGGERVLSLADAIYGVGFTFQQGLYHAAVEVELKTGERYRFQGGEFPPQTNFFGLISDQPIRTIRLVAPGSGSFMLRSFYFYADHEFPREFGARPTQAASPTFSAKLIGTSADAIAARGQLVRGAVIYQNTGTRPWVKGDSASQLMLSHDNAIDVGLPVPSGWGVDWIAEHRVALQTQDVVAPGGLCSFIFSLQVPPDAAGGQYALAFNAFQEHRGSIGDGGVLRVRVVV